MKLITEHYDNLNIITEGTGDLKRFIIEGIFMQANKVNRNRRLYPKEILERAVARYNSEQVKTGRAVGELDHPAGPQINLDRISHRITDLRFEGDDVVGKAQILDTPMGKIVKGLLEGGVKLGVSSRGMGSVEKKGQHTVVREDFVLATVDIVQDPSAQDAFVNGIMEGREWIWENGLLKPQQLESYETEINRATSKDLGDVQAKVFADFLSKLEV